MQKLAFSLLLCCFTLQSYAKVEPLKGFHYASEQAPKGNEWESPENLALNKEQPHAYFFSFQDKASARKVLPENSAYWQSLNGDWKFNWVPNPEERPKDFYKTEFDPKRRNTKVRNSYLCEPTGYFSTQSSCG